jgi:CRISPR-associated protein Cas1
VRNRILEIAEQPAKLRIERRQLVIQLDDRSRRIPLEDIAVLIVAHPQVTYTQAVLSELTAVGGIFITCNSSRMPVGLLLPLEGHSTQTERFRLQLQLTKPQCKQLWQRIVRAKITMQAALLEILFGSDSGLRQLLSRVRSGDPANVEAQAARRYWIRLFGSDFRRDRDAADHNRLLNYGYAVLRAATARAIVAAGLHPSLGLHHHNRYNAWCLVDDLMEPYRPLVDLTVARLTDQTETVCELDSSTRRELLTVLTGAVRFGGERRTLFDALAKTASSLAGVVTNENVQLQLPGGLVDAPQ